MDPLWMLNPEDQIIGRVLQRSSEIGTLAEVKERDGPTLPTAPGTPGMTWQVGQP
jgi:hypothetical protein